MAGRARLSELYFRLCLRSASGIHAMYPCSVASATHSARVKKLCVERLWEPSACKTPQTHDPSETLLKVQSLRFWRRGVRNPSWVRESRGCNSVFPIR